MDTIFIMILSVNGFTCMQVFVGFISRMIGVCPMKSKEAIHIVAACQDFMRHEGVPQALHRDAAPEQKVEKIMEINRDMKVKDSWSEPGHPNQNPVEAIGVKF